jgi:hypothetical protein
MSSELAKQKRLTYNKKVCYIRRGNEPQISATNTQKHSGVRRSANPFRYNRIVVQMTKRNTFNRVLGKLLKDLSLLAGTGNP